MSNIVESDPVFSGNQTVVAVHYLRDNIPVPQYHSDGAAGFDLAIPDAISVPANATTRAPLGLVIRAPRNHFMMVVPRSSTYKRWGVILENGVGIVDEDYCGPEDELALLIRNGENHDKIIPAGTRLAQGIFVPYTRGIFVNWGGPIAESRGGWGSTGV